MIYSFTSFILSGFGVQHLATKWIFTPMKKRNTLLFLLTYILSLEGLIKPVTMLYVLKTFNKDEITD